MKQNSKYLLKKINFIGFLILLISVNASFGQSKVEQLDELINLYTDYGQFNGSVLVAEKSEVIYRKGFGMANMEWNIPNQSDTKHRLGSITKQFTSMLIMQLVEQGKLKLDVPISTYLPDYPKSNGDIITIHHLLTHTSGTPNYTSFPGFFRDSSRDPYTPEEFVNVFADSTLEFQPGERYAYSNSGYFLLGVIIEKVTGKSYEQVLKDNITIPLKMNNTGYDHHGTILANRASGYEKNGSNYRNAAYLDMTIPYAAGSLYSTVEDLYLWDQALYTNQLLAKANMDLLFTEHIRAGSGYYGYGWGIGTRTIGTTNDSVEVISHGGGINGFNTRITRIPSDKSIIVLFNNTGGAPLGQMTNAILGILYNGSYDMPKKSLANSLYEVINEKGLAEGLKHFEKLKDSETYSLREGEMNIVGYQLLQSDKIKEAIEVFKLNVASFPESGNVYDSLGEAYLKDGNKELAIKNYKKSVALDPKNDNGIKILKELQSNN
jgi:CubicO group peptidase (beta-lactamase class C family)